jgi:hypothetical protein
MVRNEGKANEDKEEEGGTCGGEEFRIRLDYLVRPIHVIRTKSPTSGPMSLPRDWSRMIRQ